MNQQSLAAEREAYSEIARVETTQNRHQNNGLSIIESQMHSPIDRRQEPMPKLEGQLTRFVSHCSIQVEIIISEYLAEHGNFI
ncbi:unnamed protein product [Thlaspi arvense]|uniref:Uncharacterized protein n=1 Tax=Thlaspi arvense TaxID=13288 RepID=A0AAU9RS73_THLAR|nr:unnamed protein product [Thlaspi arvense]